MRCALLSLAAINAVLACLALQASQARAATDAAAATSQHELVARVIVKYRDHSPTMRALSVRPASQRQAQMAAALARRWGLSLVDGHPIGERAQLVIGHGISSAELASKLAADSEVEYAEPDRRRTIRAVPNDPLYDDNQVTATPTVGQWYLRPPTSTNVSAVNAQGAWSTTRGTSSIVVAVLDTGVRFDHPDLIGKLLPGYDFVNDTKTANDGDGRDANPSDPGDWVTSSEINSDPSFANCSATASSWHGTQVAGIIGAATQNAFGMASVAPNVMVLPVRVLGKCGGFDSDIQAAMLWAAGLSESPVRNPHPAKVLNLSLGGEGACTTSYKDVIARLTDAGVTVVVSAGNDAGLAVDSPANCEGAFAVAGLRHAGSKVGFSSIGPEVTISAPAGNCVNETGACLFPLLTTDNLGSTSPGSNTFSNSTQASFGTSFSAPLVSGTVGLMLSVNPQLTPAQIKSAVQASARPFPTSGAGSLPTCHAPNGTEQLECYCTTSTCGAGMLDTAAAVQIVTPATAPVVPISASTANPSLGTQVTLEASEAAAQAGRSVASYAWSIVSGEGLAQFTSATDGPTATLQALGSGWVTVMLTVTDSTGESTSSRTMFAISGPPTAAISPTAASVTIGTTATLSAASSTGVGGRVIAQYQWEVTSGNAALSLIGNVTGPSVTLHGRAVGDAVVRLTLTDDAGQSTSTEAQVTITPAPPPSSGGGALGWGWLIALAAAVAATRRAVEGRTG